MKRYLIFLIFICIGCSLQEKQYNENENPCSADGGTKTLVIGDHYIKYLCNNNVVYIRGY